MKKLLLCLSFLLVLSNCYSDTIWVYPDGSFQVKAKLRESSDVSFSDPVLDHAFFYTRELWEIGETTGRREGIVSRYPSSDNIFVESTISDIINKLPDSRKLPLVTYLSYRHSTWINSSYSISSLIDYLEILIPDSYSDLYNNTIYDLSDDISIMVDVITAALKDRSGEIPAYNKFLYFDIVNPLFGSQYVEYTTSSTDFNRIDAFYKHQRYLYHGLELWSESQVHSLISSGLVKNKDTRFGGSRHLTIAEHVVAPSDLVVDGIAAYDQSPYISITSSQEVAWFYSNKFSSENSETYNTVLVIDRFPDNYPPLKCISLCGYTDVDNFINKSLMDRTFSPNTNTRIIDGFISLTQYAREFIIFESLPYYYIVDMIKPNNFEHLHNGNYKVN